MLKQMTLQDIPKIKHTDANNFFLLAGPCAIENEDMAMRIAEKVISITDNAFDYYGPLTQFAGFFVGASLVSGSWSERPSDP